MLVYFLNDAIYLKMETTSTVIGHELLKEVYNPGTIILCGILGVTVWQIHEVILFWCNSYELLVLKMFHLQILTFPSIWKKKETLETW